MDTVSRGRRDYGRVLAAGILACLCLAVGCAAPAPPAQLLNSERIEHRFGSFGIEVLYQDGALRVSNLYSIEDGCRLGRTLAVVEFFHPSPELAAEHDLVLGGESLGAVFKAAGWAIEKRHLYLAGIPMDADSRFLEQWMGDVGGSTLAVHGYVLSVRKAGSGFDYATITEVHRPDYLGLAELRAIYGDISCADCDKEFRSALARARQQMPAHPAAPESKMSRCGP